MVFAPAVLHASLMDAEPAVVVLTRCFDLSVNQKKEMTHS